LSELSDAVDDIDDDDFTEMQNVNMEEVVITNRYSFVYSDKYDESITINLASPHDLASWTVLVEAAKIRLNVHLFLILQRTLMKA